jgi:hypothetical protein
MRAARDVRSISSTRSSLPRSIVTAAACLPSAGGSTPPTTLEPPPYGIAAAPAAAHQSRTAVSSASSRGRAIASGGFGYSRASARTTSRNDLP